MNVNFLITAGTAFLILIGSLIYFAIDDRREKRKQTPADKQG
jgi:heme/copper-type cytochrome/quinol oxidase subunit 2